MGYNISQLKLQYYPTDLRICNYFMFLHFDILHKDEEAIRNVFGASEEVRKRHDEYKTVWYEKYPKKKDWYKIPSYSAVKFQEMVIENNILSKDFEFKYSIKDSSGYTSRTLKTSIVDLFAGKGEWLNLYKQYIDDFQGFIKTLGVELSKERYEEMKTNTDYAYHSAFEDIEIPQESISLLLFNPPYDTVDGERLTKIYLQNIIDRKILIECESYVDFVIREDDFRDCLDLIQDHFTIIKDSMAKAPSDEFSKFKQVVFTARYKYHRKSALDTRYLIEERQNLKQTFLEKVDNLETINITNIPPDNLKIMKDLKHCLFIDKVKAIQLKNNNKNKISFDNDMAWNWLKDLTEIKTDTIGGLIVPKKLKQGEIINIISSGYINGQINNHIISGGTRQVEEEIKTLHYGDDGQEKEQIEVRKINKPYLNVLLPNGEIKRLLDKEIKEVD